MDRMQMLIGTAANTKEAVVVLESFFFFGLCVCVCESSSFSPFWPSVNKLRMGLRWAKEKEISRDKSYAWREREYLNEWTHPSQSSQSP